MSSLTRNGTRILHYLTVGDMYPTKDEMSEGHWDMLEACHHRGACDEDVEEAARYFEVKDYQILKEHLKEYGAWDEIELSDDDANLKRYLWLLSGDMHESGAFNADECDDNEIDEHAEDERMRREANLK